jgi:hypothetical protein
MGSLVVNTENSGNGELNEQSSKQTNNRVKLEEEAEEEEEEKCSHGIVVAISAKRKTPLTPEQREQDKNNTATTQTPILKIRG